VGDLGKLWDYRTLNRAFRLLYHNPDAQLIALGMTRYWLAPDGIALDVAPFVVALEHASGRKPLVFGKPARPFFQAAVEKLGLPAGQVVMIGDDIEADVGGAQTAGLKGALVKTASSALQTLKARSNQTSYLLPLLIYLAGGMGKQCENHRDISGSSIPRDSLHFVVKSPSTIGSRPVDPPTLSGHPGPEQAFRGSATGVVVQSSCTFVKTPCVPGFRKSEALAVEVMAKFVAEGTEERSERGNLFLDGRP
jgi:hypothetical protein